MNDRVAPRATFTSMEQSTVEDWVAITTEFRNACQKSGSAKMNSYAPTPTVLRASKKGAVRKL